MTDPDRRPVLSVIVTCFNIEKYLEECLDSVVGQSLDDIEIIVVDDGSTDATPSIIERYAMEDRRIVPILLEENSPGGVATAANVALDRATGRYVGFVDGDDFCRATAFERLVDLMERCGADVAMSRFELFHDGPEPTSYAPELELWAELDSDDYLLNPDERKRFLHFAPAPWRKLYRRDFLEKHRIRFPEVDYFYEDVPFHWYCMVNAHSLAVLPEVLFFHRTGRVGQTESAVDERLLRMFDHHEGVHQWLAQRGVTDQYGSTLLAWVLSQMEGTGRQCRGDLRRQLFDALVPIISTYDDATVERALVEGRSGKMVRELTKTLTQNNFPRFDRLLQGPSNPSSVTANLRFHLRYSGITTTAQHAINRIKRRSMPSEISEARAEWRRLHQSRNS